MSFYFAWQQSEESFCPQAHAREDVKVFSLVIEAQEGGFPLAKVRIQNRHKGLGALTDQQTAYLSYRRQGGTVELLFKGRLCQVPEKIEGETYEIHLTAEPAQSDRHLQKLHQSLKQDPTWDPLFVGEEDQDDPKESLEARPCLFYWSRTGEPVSLSNLFEGRQHLEIGGDFLRDSLKMTMAELPLKAVRLRLKTSWQQTYRGRIDLTYFLRSKFPGGLVNTLSGPDLQAKWWKAGERLGQSGYWVAESALEEIDPPYTGALGLYPKRSHAVWVSPRDPAARHSPHPFQTKLKRFWYRSRLILGWQYRQRRREMAEVYLENNVQPLGPDLHKVRTLTLSLRQPGPTEAGSGDPSHASFFTTDRGHQCLAHALDRAKAHLEASSRAVEIQFSGAFEALSSVTCDHSLTLMDDRLPGQKVTGKVKAYRLVAQGEQGIFRADVTLACAVGKPEKRPKSEKIGDPEKAETPEASEHREQGADARRAEALEAPPYAGPSYCEEPLGGVPCLTSSQGVPFEACYSQKPRQGLLNPRGLTAYDLIEEVEIVNGPEAQNAHLRENQYPQRHTIQGALNEVKTNIHVRLRDLRSQPAQLHKIHVRVPGKWSPPCQIDLSAS